MKTIAPLKRHPPLFVAIPASLVSDIPHLREKTSKIGFLGRALAIFRVDEVIIYPDASPQKQVRDIELIASILSYLETPQYLRKALFKIKQDLSYSGILPPLRTPHHPKCNSEKNLMIGEYREGVVISRNKNTILVDIGVERPATVINEKVAVNTRVTVKVTEKNQKLKAKLVDPKEIKIYWGYKVTVSREPLGRMLRNRSFDLVIATSRLGEPFMKIFEEIRSKWKESKNVLIAFGSPTKGLHEILKQEKINIIDIADFIVNTIPNQATETVRTEEALYTTLSIFNLLIS